MTTLNSTRLISKLLTYITDTKKDFGNNSSKVLSYFTGVDAIYNPSGNTDNLVSVKYFKGETLKITELFTYDATDRITKIETIYG